MNNYYVLATISLVVLILAITVLVSYLKCKPTSCPNIPSSQYTGTPTGRCLLACDQSSDSCYQNCDPKDEDCIRGCYQMKASCYMNCLGPH